MSTTEPTQEELQEASDPTTPPERLEHLANTVYDVAHLIVQNPNAPVPLLLELAETYPKEFLQNPALPLFLVERPDFMEEASEELLETLTAMDDDRILTLLQNHSLYWVRRDAFFCASNPPLALIERYANDEDPSSRRTAAQHKATPLTVLQRLSDDSDEGVRAALVLHPRLTEELFEKLLQDESPSVRASFLHRAPLTEPLLSRLLADPAPSIRDAIILRDDLPEAILKETLRHPDPAARRKLLERRGLLPEFVLSALCQERDPDTLRLLCQKPELTASHLEALSKHEALHFLISAHPGASAALLSSLYGQYQAWGALRILWERFTNKKGFAQHQSEQEIRKNIARHPNTPEGVLEAIAYSAEDELLPLVAQHPKVSEKALSHLAKYPYPELQSAVALHPRTPKESLRSLAKQTSLSVVSAAAKNPNTPLEVLQVLAAHEDYSVRSAVAQNPSATTEILSLLLGDRSANYHVTQHPNRPQELCHLSERVQKKEPLSEAELRQAIQLGPYLAELASEHPSITAALWEELRRHKNVWVRYGVAKNAPSPELLRKLYQDSSLTVLFGLLSNPALPEDLLERFALNTEAELRKKVIQHPKVTEAILRGLASDSNPELRQLAQKALSQRPA